MTAKLKLPPGIYKNGTDYMSAGRYNDCDLIRWDQDVITPIQGWQLRTDFITSAPLSPLWVDGIATEAARSGIVMTDETAGVSVLIGTNKKIYSLSASNVKTDVTPAGFSAQAKHAVYAIGYGLFRYSYGKYGTPRPASAGRVANVFSWGFSEWGFWPIAVARNIAGKHIFIKKATDATFIDIANSPTGVFDAIVTDERFLMSLGSPTDFRIVKWSDQEQYDVWAPAITNQAGSYRLAGKGRLVRAVKVLNNVLILGDDDAFTAQYIGPPYVYGFNRVGNRCGIIGPEAVAVTSTFAMWIGNKGFWRFDGTVSQVPCDVLDFYLRDKNETQRSKTVAFSIADFSEIWWLYQSKDAVTNEPDSYLIYNHLKNVWYCGRMDRTLGLDAGALTYPVMVSQQGAVYDHEVPSAGFDGRVPFISTGPLEMDDGHKLMGIAYVYPDERLDGDVKMELNVRDMPKLPVRYSRQFDLLSPTSTQGIAGRDIRMKLYGSGVGSPTWSIGDFRVEPLQGAMPGR